MPDGINHFEEVKKLLDVLARSLLLPTLEVNRNTPLSQ